MFEKLDHLFLTKKNPNLISFSSIDDPHPFHPPVIKREDAFNIPLLESLDVSIRAEKGIYRVYIPDDTKEWILVDNPVFDRNQFIEDYTLLSAMITDGPLKSFCYRRLKYL